MTLTKSRRTKRNCMKRGGTKRNCMKRSGGGQGLSKLAPEHKPLPRNKIYVYLDTLAIKAPNPWIPPTVIADGPRRQIPGMPGNVKILTKRLLAAPASIASDSSEQLLALDRNLQRKKTQRMKSALSHVSSIDELNFSKLANEISDLKKQLFKLLFSKNPIDCGRQLTHLADVPFLIDVIVEKLKTMLTICVYMGPKCPLLSHSPDKYNDIFNALLRCREIHHSSDWYFISQLERTIVPPNTEPEALRTRFRFSPERIEGLIHHFNGLKSVILTCIDGGSNPPLKSANPSLYNFLKKDAINNPTLLQDLDKDEIKEFKEYMHVRTLIRTMTMSEVDQELRAKYIKKIMDMIKSVYSGEEMELRLIAALGASQPLPDDDPDMEPFPECDELMAGLAGLMPRITNTLNSRVANLGEVEEFW